MAVVIERKGLRDELVHVDDSPAMRDILRLHRVCISGKCAVVRIGMRWVPLHTLIMGPAPPGKRIAYVNHDPLDCRAKNLRFVPLWVWEMGHGAGMVNWVSELRALTQHYGGWKAYFPCPAGRVITRDFADSKYGGTDVCRAAACAWLAEMETSLSIRDEVGHAEKETPAMWWDADRTGGTSATATTAIAAVAKDQVATSDYCLAMVNAILAAHEGDKGDATATAPTTGEAPPAYKRSKQMSVEFLISRPDECDH
jgi:hypothetical protein